ncbi:MAG: hypothetical protein I8H98_11260 [Moraxellaceae bacterium]|nr:hypothetical protein [Moraxellaceae bacterium]
MKRNLSGQTRRLLGQTEQSKNVHNIVDRLVDKHLKGSGFYQELQEQVGSALNLNEDEMPQLYTQDVSNELQGNAFGLYVKKKAKKGGDLGREIGGTLDRSKKPGRPKNPEKQRRTFDPNSKTARRGAKVKEIMQKMHLSFIEASKYIAANGIPY